MPRWRGARATSAAGASGEGSSYARSTGRYGHRCRWSRRRCCATTHSQARSMKNSARKRTKSGENFTDCSSMFVVGSARSGTTLLQMMLNAHPDTAVAGELHFKSRFPTSIRRIASTSFSVPCRRARHRLLAADQPGYGLLYRFLLEGSFGSNPLPRFGEKTNANVRYLDELVMLFPPAPTHCRSSGGHLRYSGTGLMPLPPPVASRTDAGRLDTAPPAYSGRLPCHHLGPMGRPWRSICPSWRGGGSVTKIPVRVGVALSIAVMEPEDFRVLRNPD